MRFIHTGDWHLGKLLRERSLVDVQELALDGLVRLAERVDAEAIVVAGDVYDRAVAPTEAIRVLDKILKQLTVGLHIPVVMIAGNHDSAVRLEYLNGLVSEMGLHVVGTVGPEPRGVRLRGGDGLDVVFWPLAYTDPETARHDLGGDIHTHEAALQAQLDLIRERRDDDARHVVVAHAFVVGAEPTESSERPLSVGGSEQVSRSVFHDFDYVALGHLHLPQRVGADNVRYAGSLLQYSFDEVEQRKSVSVVDLGADGAVAVREEQLPVRRRLCRLEGSFDEVMERPDAADYQDDFVEVVLTDTDPVIDPMQRLRAVYPNILSLRREAWLAQTRAQASLDVPTMSTRELFAEFFSEATQQQLTEVQQGEVDAALAATERDGREG